MNEVSIKFGWSWVSFLGISDSKLHGIRSYTLHRLGFPAVMGSLFRLLRIGTDEKRPRLAGAALTLCASPSFSKPRVASLKTKTSPSRMVTLNKYVLVILYSGFLPVSYVVT